MNNSIKQAVSLYKTAQIMTVHSVQLLEFTRDILNLQPDGFKQADINPTEFSKTMNNARFTLLVSYYDKILDAKEVQEYDSLVRKIESLRNQCSFDEAQMDIINQKNTAKFINLAERRAKMWLDSSSSYRNLTIEISHVYTALASAGLTDLEKNDIFYDPALSNVGLSPDVVNAKLKEAAVKPLNDQAKYIVSHKVEASLAAELLESYISNLAEVNLTWDKWLVETDFSDDDKVFLNDVENLIKCNAA